MAAKHIPKGKITPPWMLIQFRANRILGLKCLADRVVDGVLLLMAVYRRPFADGRIKTYAAAFHLYAQIAVVGMANEEVCFSILCLLLFSPQYPPDLEKDDVLLRKLVSQCSVDLRLCLRWQVIELRLREIRNHCRHRHLPEYACGASSGSRWASAETFHQTGSSKAWYFLEK